MSQQQTVEIIQTDSITSQANRDTQRILRTRT